MLENIIINCPTTSNWLKEQCAITKKRDPIDAYNDTVVLLTVLEDRINLLRSNASLISNQKIETV